MRFISSIVLVLAIPLHAQAETFSCLETQSVGFVRVGDDWETRDFPLQKFVFRKGDENDRMWGACSAYVTSFELQEYSEAISLRESCYAVSVDGVGDDFLRNCTEFVSPSSGDLLAVECGGFRAVVNGDFYKSRAVPSWFEADAEGDVATSVGVCGSVLAD
ncbi:MAG: hypothetical protein O9289_07570 [Rhodobacteraceae bacterium]|nr:hypothetical protein [Paracoccaceae bacterium]MCZ8083051.1 hypothetical protein [Paracoccaceae bacterium]